MTDQHAITFSKILTYFGSAFTIVMGLSLTEWGIVVGIVTALAGMGFGQYWQARRAKGDAEMRAAYIEAIKRPGAIIAPPTPHAENEKLD